MFSLYGQETPDSGPTADVTPPSTTQAILDSLSQLVDISGKAAAIKQALSKSGTIPAPRIAPPPSAGMSTTTMLMLGLGGVAVLGLGYVLLAKK